MLTIIVIIAVAVVIFILDYRISKHGWACAFLGHDVPKNALVHELGAIHHGGICRRCHRIWMGEFFCNSWDENKTEERDGITILAGINPLLLNGDWEMVDWDKLWLRSEELRRRK